MFGFGNNPVNTAPTVPTAPAPTETADQIKQRKALAQALMQQGMQQKQTQNVGGYNIPTTPLESIANLANSAAAAYMMK